jgi:2'-5' RNA ligase
MADDLVMVALIPFNTDLMKVTYPHLTLVFAGKASDLSPSDLDGLAKAASSIAMFSRPVTLRTLTKDVFGQGTIDDPKVDVLRFHPNLELLKMRSVVEDWNASQFPFNPHVTVGPEGSWMAELPSFVAFHKVAFCVGADHQDFLFSGGGFE